MADKMGSLLLIVVSIAMGAHAQMDTSVCTLLSPGPNDPKKPLLSDQFEVHTECNIHNKGYSVDYHEFFDRTNNRAAAHVDSDGKRFSEIYSFDTNELFRVNYTQPPGTCTVTPLSQSHRLFLFGTATSGGTVAMYNKSQVFHYSQFPEKWISKAVVRGIKTDLWRSCQYWPKLNSTMTVDWYFSDPKAWTTSTLNMAVPVRANVYGKTWTNNAPHPFNHTYEYADFMTSIQDMTAFETPAGVYCPKRKATKPLPKPATAFHFTSEVLFPNYHPDSPQKNQIGYVKEYYNYDLDLMRFDRTPVTMTKFGMNPRKTIHDFNTGVAYIIDDVTGNCTVESIESDDYLDVKNVDATHVRIRSSKEFFYFDNTSYTYEGTKAVRGMLADVWIAQRNDFPKPGYGLNSTFEWYFLTPAFTSNIPGPLKFGIPVRLTINAGNILKSIYNIYGYSETSPDIWTFDISICYNYTQKRDFSFLLPGHYRQAADSNLEIFKYDVLLQIQGITGVSALRVNNIQIDYADNNDIIVKFTLLDKAPPIGDVVNPKKQEGLNAVATRLSNAINTGKFVVKIVVGGNPTIMTAKPYTLTPTQHVVQRSYYQKTNTQSIVTGSSGGVMAGMAVALLVVFFLVGVGGTYMFYRRSGGAFLPKKFDNTDITQDTS